jgi:hypothetical protein
MCKKDIDDLNQNVLRYKTEFKEYKRDLDRQNNTFKLELIKSLNDQYESEYINLKNEITLLANKNNNINKESMYQSNINHNNESEFDLKTIKDQ